MSEENPIARMQRRLRADTAKLLNYDIDNLSAWQSVRLDRASTLRLQLDDISAAQLRGDPIDMPRFILASKELEAMLGGNPETSTAHDFSGAREELARFFAGRAEAIRRRDERLAEAKAASDIPLHASITPDPAGGPAQHDEGCPLPALVESAAAVGGSGATEPAPPPQPVLSAEAKMDRANAVQPPANYLKQPDEEWRRWVDEDGIRSSPWSRRGY